MTSLMKVGAARIITEEDLPPLPPADESVQLGHTLKMAMEKQCVLDFGFD